MLILFVSQSKEPGWQKSARFQPNSDLSCHYFGLFRRFPMNKLKAKLEGVVKSTAMSAQQIYKHKSFNFSKTQEDPEYGFVAWFLIHLDGTNPARSF